MPGEEYPHVSPGGSQWERVSDAEAAVVFNQRTWGTLQLPAQQVIWEVINIEGHPNWSKNKKCMTGLCLLLLAVRIHWSSFCSHLLTVSSWLSFVNQLCIGLTSVQMFIFEETNVCCLNTEGGSTGRYRVSVHMWDVLYVFMKWSGCMKWMYVCIFFSGFSSLVYCFDLCVNQSLHQDTVSTAPYMHIPSTFMPHSYASH